MQKLILLLSLTFFFASCALLNRALWLPDDNPIEECIEEKIKEKTGIDIDLTPLSPENPPLGK